MKANGFVLRGEGKKSHEKRKDGRKGKQENVLSYHDEENSRSETPASWEFAGAENTLCVCTGSSDAALNTSEGWSKDGCDGSDSSEPFPT